MDLPRPVCRKNQGPAPSSPAHWRWRRALCWRRERHARGRVLFRHGAARPSFGTGPVLLVRQLHGPRLDVALSYRGATVSEGPDGGRLNQAIGTSMMTVSIMGTSTGVSIR